MATAINYQSLAPEDVLEYAERTLGVCGAPIRSAGVDLNDYDDIVAKYLPAEDFPNPMRPYGVLTLAQIEAAAVSLVAVKAAATARTTNKTKAEAFLAAVSSVRSELATFKTQATTLSGRTYSGTTAAQLAAIQTDMRAIGTRLAALMDVLDKMVDGEVFLGREIIR